MQPIIAPLKPNYQNEQVSNLQEALLLFLDKKIIEPSDQERAVVEGRLKEEKQAQFYGETTGQLVMLFRVQHQLNDHREVDAETAEAMNKLLDELGVLDEVKPAFVVRGTVRYTNGEPAIGLKVEAIDKDLRDEDPLGNNFTNAKGEYIITYTSDNFTRAEKGNADLLIRVYDEAGKKVASSINILFNARPEETIDITVNKEETVLSEYEQIVQDISPILRDIPIHELNEEDVSFLAGDTGFSLERISWVVRSGKLSKETELPAEVFYGWFRQGLPIELHLLWESSANELIEALKQAIKNKIIPAQISSQLDDIKSKIDLLRVDNVLRPAPEGRPPSLGDVLGTLPEPVALDSGKRLVVAGVLLNNGYSDDTLGEKLINEGLSDNEVYRVQRSIGLQTFTQNHLPLMKALQLENPDGRQAQLTDLANLEQSQWVEIVEQNGVPGNIEGQDEHQKQQIYADQLAHFIEEINPSAWIAYRISDDRFPVNGEIKEELQTFFSKNIRFQMGKTSVLSFFDNPETLVLEGIEEPEKVKDELFKMERIVNCSPRLEMAGQLLRMGFHSAYSITHRSKERFIEEIVAQFPEIKEHAGSIYQKAVERTASSTAIATEYIRAVRDTPLAIMQPPPQSSSSALTAATAQQIANLQTLFGNLDYCECAHCSSVYSPAAYLVDLMNVLDSGTRAKTNNKSPLDVLLERRPDIAEIDLTCENTNTSIPYTDLALEVLENKIGTSTSNSARSFSFELSDSNNNAYTNFKNDLNSNKVPELLITTLAKFGIASGNQNWTVQLIAKNSNWVLRISGWKINVITLNPNAQTSSVKIISWPQTSGTTAELSAIPHFINPEPYTNQLRNALHPWSLPFDLWREETNVWLGQLKIERYSLMEAFAGNNRYSDAPIAYEFLGLSSAEAEKLVLPPANDGWQQWGFNSNIFGNNTDAINDPIAGDKISYPSLSSDAFKPATKNWYDALVRISLLRHRAGLTQRELMNLLETKFINPTQIRLEGDECDASKATLAIDVAALSRIHIFVRLWRKLTWTGFDLDRAIQAFPSAFNVSASKTYIFNNNFLIFLANIDRLRQQYGLSPDMLLNWYTTTLNTQQYVGFSGSQPRFVPSPYEKLFYDRSVARPKDPAFELNSTRAELVPSTPLETIRSKHSVVAAALSVKPAEIDALLPKVKDSISQSEISQPTDGLTIDRTGTNRPILELDLREIRGAGANFTIVLQHADFPTGTTTSPQFSGIPEVDLDNTSQPPAITNQNNQRILRFAYTGTKPLLRFAVTNVQGTDPINNPPKLNLAGRILLDPATVSDDLSLTNLSALSRYTQLAKAVHLSVKELLLTIDLTGINPFSTPEATLNLIDHLQKIQSSGFSLAELDYLLRHKSLEQSGIALTTQQAANILTEIRQGLQQIQLDTALQIDERGEITRKWLSFLQWPSGIIDELQNRDNLNRDRIESFYDANHLPLGVTLPSSMQYDRANRNLSISFQSEPSAITALDTVRQAGLKDQYFVDAIDRLKSQVKPTAKKAETTYEGFNFPPGVVLPAFIEYDQPSRRLIITNKALITQLDTLKNLTSDQDFQTAVENLKPQVEDAHRIANEIRKRMLNYVILENTVPLSQLPITIPQNWSGRFFFKPTSSPANSQLVFVGVMSAADKQALIQLAPNNTSYTNAIEALYQKSNTVSLISGSPEFIHQTLAEKLVFELQNPQERFADILSRLLPYVRKQLNYNLLSEKLSLAISIESSITDRLLKKLKFPQNNPLPITETFLEPAFAATDPKITISRDGFEQQFRALELVYKAGVLISRSGVKPTQVDWLFDTTWLNLLNLSQLPLEPDTSNNRFASWINLILLLQLWGRLPGGEQTIDRLKALLDQTPAPTWDSFQSAVADSINWPNSDFKLLLSTNRLGFTGLNDFRQPEKISHLADCLSLVLKLGATAELAISWKKSALTANDALAARQLVRSHYDQETWYQLAQPIQNKLRKQRRAALLDYLIANEGVRDSNDLFGKYLIDSEMGSCMMTTRILQATGTVQLFIHRCLMGLERDVPASAINKESWQWMKNYRVWEANRKVFFYPENWIEPELREDKSPIFQELESELLQGDITSQKAEKALQSYLTKLDEIARLEVIGMYRDTPIDENNKPKYGLETLHVFGRTYSEPRKYYYRRYHKLGIGPTDGYWTAWEKVDLDIDDVNYLFPVVWQKKPYLFWLTFKEKAEEIVPIDNKPTLPKKFWEIGLAWSSYENGKWQARQIYSISNDNINQIFTTVDRSAFSLMGHDNGRNIRYGLIAPFKTGSNLIQKVQQLNYDSYGIDLFENDENFAKIFSSKKIIPALTWDKTSDAQILVYSMGKMDVFSNPRLNIRIIYLHQELDRGFGFRAPYYYRYETNSPQGELFSDPAHFVLSDPQKRSFFGYPYWSPLAIFGFVEPRIQFTTFYHPQTLLFQQVLRKASIGGLLSLTTQNDTSESKVFSALIPNPALIPEDTWPNLNVDFSPSGAYSQYNWELFFHLPFIVATHLSKNQRFEEARQWFHYIFDPTDSSGGKEPERFWHFKEFNVNSQTTPIQTLARILADPNNISKEKHQFDLQVQMWLDNPFKPHAVARLRNRAYMFSVVMKYLDNLISWGDQLFRRDTRESLNEAIQIYILAAQILGRKPEGIPRRTHPQTQSFSEIRGKLDSLGNIQVNAENVLLRSGNSGQSATSLPPMPTLLFCVPENQKILEYYDKVADRLFKMRNCMNIDGVVRQLALFDPPIDPAILVKAAAAGIDLSTALSDLNVPTPLYRFNIMSQKASEICAEVKGMGGTLLAALEKRDGEAMALLRSKHEINLLQHQRQVKEFQVEEAKINIEAMAKSIEGAQTRFTYYVGLISALEDLNIPTGPVEPQAQRLIQATLDTLGQTSGVLKVVTAITNPLSALSFELLKQTLSRAAEALSPDLAAQNGDSAKVPMIPAEKRQLEELKESHDLQQKVKDQQAVAQILARIPDITLGIQGAMASPVVQAQIGGSLLSTVAQIQANEIEYQSSEHAYRASLHSMLAGYQRRAADWLHQAKLAMIDIQQLTDQCKAAAVRLKIADEELRIHDHQIENSQKADEFMRSKYTNQELYDWMVGQISSTYFQSYQLAYDVAKKAEKAYRFELGLRDTDTNFIQFGYWDSMKKGLMAGERLYQDIKRMEVAYLDQNKREFELTKHVSIAALNPLLLLQLKEIGKCTISLPEELFDLDYQGHYFRRIKSVSISIPCIAGPYTTINCTLRLLKTSIRANTSSGDYARDQTNGDNRFRDDYMVQSIATSSSQNDSGLFELNFRDERYMPFEGKGVVSDWSIELTGEKTLRQFDYNTISDVIMHIKYTAREDAGQFKEGVVQHLDKYLKEAIDKSPQPMMRLFSLKHDFPEAFHQLINITNGIQKTEIEISKDHFPILFNNRTITLAETQVFLKPKSGKTITKDPTSFKLSSKEAAWSEISGSTMRKSVIESLGELVQTKKISIEAGIELTGSITDNEGLKNEEVDDVLLLLQYKVVVSTP